MIAICTPTRDVVQGGFTFDLVNLIKKSPDTFFAISMGTILLNARTNLVKQALENHASHILFIDSDMRFPEDTLEQLLVNDKEVVAANCKHRQANKWTAGISSKGKKGLLEVTQLGFGVVLIRMDVFMQLPEPWFAMPYDGEKFVGDDTFFCQKARKAGFKLYIDHDLSQQIKHTGSKDY